MKLIAGVFLLLSAVVSYGQSLPFGSRPASGGGGGSSFTVIQSPTPAASGVWTATITPTATGHLIAGTGLFGSAGCAAGSLPITDTAGNTWITDKTLVDSANTNFTFITFHAIANGTSATTITVNPGACFDGGIAVAEVSGVSTLDVAGSATSAPSSTPTITLATNHSNEFCTLQGNLLTQPGGFTATWSTLQTMNTGVGGGELGGDQFINGPSTGTSTTMTSTASYGGWVLIGACYK